MKNLGRAIDQILKIEPSLDVRLMPIKIRWENNPRKAPAYWTQLLKILNIEVGPNHPKRMEIQGVLVSKKKLSKKQYTFEPPSETEKILGVIPENLEFRFKKYDQMQIQIAKRGLEARLTHNRNLMIQLTRQTEILEVNQKKLWFDLKNHFNLWSLEGNHTLLIRQHKDGYLLLTVTQTQQLSHSIQEGDSFLMRMDPELLKRFFKFLNMQPPPGIFPE
jgi:hypothetical protein